MDHLELLGPIVHLQVQVASLKQGEKPHRWYDPQPITVVPYLELDEGGVTGVDDAGARVGDVHHRDHESSKHRSENGISIGFTSHYALMRNRFGDHLADGVAGENMLIRHDQVFTEADFANGLMIMSEDGSLTALDRVVVAAPCAEFSKFSLGYDRDQRSDRNVTEALQFLHNGVRGFYTTLQSGSAPATIGTGALVYRRL